jgi:superfamily I DNA/RNA helicase
LPDVVLTGPIGLQPRAIAIDGADLPVCATSIERLLRHWEQFESTALVRCDLERVVGALAPTLVVRRRLGATVADAEAEIIRLTKTQRSILSNLRRVRRCVISGTAGTGKTLLAAEKARQILAAGGSALVVCFNGPLADRLRRDLADTRAHVRTFHSLCMEMCRVTKRPIPGDLTTRWWSEAAAKELIAATAQLAPEKHFDAVLVDEAQDFRGEWLSALEALARDGDDSFVYLFTDPHQCLFHREHVLPSGWPVFELDENCRNTEPIATAAANAIGDSGIAARVTGRPVAFVEAEGSGVATVVQSVVDRLITEESVPAGEIVVLVDESSVQNRLRTMSAGGCCFVDVGLEGVQVDTVRRFKGLESAVVVLGLTSAPSLPSNDWRALLYVGVSRARSFLVVVGPRRVKGWLGLPA